MCVRAELPTARTHTFIAAKSDTIKNGSFISTLIIYY